jgi:UDP-N-acetylmuramoyl-tripeptide--D-alanyl-D-alanine ligase
MSPTPLSTVATWAGGRALSGRADLLVSNVCTDSRALQCGDFFVALRGERFDAHAFLGEAAERGAIGALVETAPVGLDPAFAVVQVSDVLGGLQSLAGAYRSSLASKVVCITGSNGKTSTKDLTAGVLGRRWLVNKTAGNLNNHIGLPLTLLRATREHEAQVVEIGMNHPGEIAPLANLARPDVAIVTNVGVAHIEHMGSSEAIALEKGMLAEAVHAGGTVVLNADDRFTPGIARRTSARVITAGLDGGDVRATDLEQTNSGMKFRLHATGQCVRAELPVIGAHMVQNAALACAAGLALGLSLEECAAGFAELQLTKGRLTIREVGSVQIIDDTYNANPDSMVAALRTLAKVGGGGRRFAVLGKMGELGQASEEGHRRAGVAAGEVGIPWLIAVGEEARWIAEAAQTGGVPNVRWVPTVDEAIETLRAEIRSGDVVLVKGSRSAKMERVVQALEGGQN